MNPLPAVRNAPLTGVDQRRSNVTGPDQTVHL